MPVLQYHNPYVCWHFQSHGFEVCCHKALLRAGNQAGKNTCCLVLSEETVGVLGELSVLWLILRPQCQQQRPGGLIYEGLRAG